MPRLPAICLAIAFAVASCNPQAGDGAAPVSGPGTLRQAEAEGTAAPAAPSPAPAPDQREARIEAWVREANPGMGRLMLKWGGFDLDGDGTEEVLAYVGGPMVCGTGGCNLVVLKDDGEAFARIGDISVAQLPIGVLDTRTNGLRDLAVSIGGGGAKAGVGKVPFDGRTYARNPTVAPATPIGSIGSEVIARGELKTLD